MFSNEEIKIIKEYENIEQKLKKYCSDVNYILHSLSKIDNFYYSENTIFFSFYYGREREEYYQFPLEYLLKSPIETASYILDKDKEEKEKYKKLQKEKEIRDKEEFKKRQYQNYLNLKIIYENKES